MPRFTTCRWPDTQADRIPRTERLLDLLAAGCHSPLELWGALEVFTGRTYYLDAYAYAYAYAEAERVDFELDAPTTGALRPPVCGLRAEPSAAAFHGSPRQRERDLRRDAVLAALGIMVVRFTCIRLMQEPDAVRREVLAILAARRRA